ncbi:GNAT family N-acetyltransferase [Paenibacillus oenotherae]|uniref:GNAT family N-acetyltransferase n=1 Tax=Paenibacillus oenotherae TaxID=1435645 RepID=A0ABS7D8U7_9BACL|nr:GNAT family N-acetyltransferase [Paenibacillus oenotherae]MBW7476369.1 GNAT family N-acetyltransferase [Paenibacillus oenotherae]
MINELQIQHYAAIRPLLKGIGINPVIEGVVDGTNLGKIYADDAVSPSAALIWAKNEMFYLVGDDSNKAFYQQLESFIVRVIKPEALAAGENVMNLEIPAYHQWQSTIESYFNNKLNRGERVPFTFRRETFQSRRSQDSGVVSVSGCELRAIDDKVIEADTEQTITTEILKFWESIEKFMDKGIGYCVMKGHEVIGTCISVFASCNDYEIGIHTYSTEYRGKGLATAMAVQFIKACIARGGVPHWTTESFREDSIAIANKLGFEQGANYPVYYHSFEELL